MEQTNQEEVKLLAQRPGDPKAADGHGCSCPKALRISKGDCAIANLVLPPRGETAEKIAAPD